MLNKIQSILFISLICLSIVACKDEKSKNEVSTEFGKIEMKIGSTPWSSTQAAAVAIAANDSSALIISGDFISSSDEENYSSIGIFLVNTTSKNHVGEYPLIYAEDEDLDATFAKGGFLTFFNTDGKFYISTSGSVTVKTGSNGKTSGTFTSILTEVVDNEDDIALAFKQQRFPNVKLGTQQLNATLTMSDGGFNVAYTNFTDFDE